MPRSVAASLTVRRPAERTAATSRDVDIGWCAFRYLGMPFQKCRRSTAIGPWQPQQQKCPFAFSAAAQSAVLIFSLVRRITWASSREPGMPQPWKGKTMIARRIPGLLPELTLPEALETTKVYSALGLVDGLITERPFR